MDDNAKINAIKKVCDGKTHDNYTCWLIPVLDVQKEETDVAQDDEEQVAVTVEQAPHETPNDAETKVNAETERLARKEAELKAREEALKQREETARKDAKLKAQQEAMRQREAAQKARAMAAVAQKAGGQRQSSGVPPIPPKQIAQQERAEEKKKMVKFALLSFAVFVVIVVAFIFFGSSEEKKTTGSELRGDDSTRIYTKFPSVFQWLKKSVPTDVVQQAKTVQSPRPGRHTRPENKESQDTAHKKSLSPPKAKSAEEHEISESGGESTDSPVSGNPASEASSSSDAIDI